MKLSKNLWLIGDNTKSRTSKNDIVVDESTNLKTRINICAFVCSKKFYSYEKEVDKVRVLVVPDLPKFGISMTFS